MPTLPKHKTNIHTRNVLEIVKIHDGDTFTVVIDQGWRDRKKLTVRMDGLDCPEISTKAGKFVKDVVEKELLDPKNNHLQLISQSLDMYGRSLVNFCIYRDMPIGFFLSDILLTNNLAKKMKVKRPKWSEEELKKAEDNAKILLSGR